MDEAPKDLMEVEIATRSNESPVRISLEIEKYREMFQKLFKTYQGQVLINRNDLIVRGEDLLKTLSFG